MNAIHFFKTHCLGSQLNFISFIRFMMTSFILYRIWFPIAFVALMSNGIFRRISRNKFYSICYTIQS